MNNNFTTDLVAIAAAEEQALVQRRRYFNPLKPFLISPPVGNYLSHPVCSSVKGSFTLQPRHGLLWNTLKSLRPVNGGWVNRIGLRNKGICSVEFDPSKIYSIVGLEDDDWELMHHWLITRAPLYLELNLGCPNVHLYGIKPEILRLFCSKFMVIVKLAATDIYREQAHMAVEAGAHYLHFSNTIPSQRGGISGTPLKKLNLPRIEWARSQFSVPVIGGGGIYKFEDYLDYRSAGATYYSMSTGWFPWFGYRARRLIEECLQWESLLMGIS